jgi:hypothetical protein
MATDVCTAITNASSPRGRIRSHGDLERYSERPNPFSANPRHPCRAEELLEPTPAKPSYEQAAGSNCPVRQLLPITLVRHRDFT